MNTPTATAGPRWHIWAVGLASLMWNAMGCLDFTLTVTRQPVAMAQMSTAMLDWLDGAPAWSIVAWGLGTWGALAGSLLLLMRNRWAVPAFAGSLLGLAGVQVWQHAGGAPAELSGAGNLAFTALLWAVAIGLLLYARRMAKAGVLR